jgi:hypothetical protein
MAHLYWAEVFITVKGLTANKSNTSRTKKTVEGSNAQ